MAIAIAFVRPSILSIGHAKTNERRMMPSSQLDSTIYLILGRYKVYQRIRKPIANIYSLFGERV